MTIYTVMLDSPFLTFFLLMGVLTLIRSIFRFIMRIILITTRGWPPEHLDADGDFKKEKENDDD